METATLTKNEEADVERMASSFSEPSMSERATDWFTRTIAAAKREEKRAEGKHRPREVKLDEGDRSDDEKKFLQTVAEKIEPEKKPPAKSATEKDAAKPAEHQSAKESEKPNAKPSEKTVGESPSEPLSGDRHWQAVEGKVAFTKEEAADHWDRVGNRAGVALEYINRSPEKAQIEAGLRGFFDTRTPGGQAFFRDFSTALAEVPNPGEVLRHIALKAEDRNWLRSNVKDWKGLRTAIQTISKHYAPSTSQPSPKPRAPKPPSEVGGRGAVPGEGGETDFGSVSARMSQRYFQR